jgi:hypothetical protein
MGSSGEQTVHRTINPHYHALITREIDLLVVRSCVLDKRDQRAELKNSYATTMDPD